jgi:predicted lipoprotein with Yx(FWY)xxD motif
MGVVALAIGIMALAACNRSASGTAVGTAGSLGTRSISGIGTVLVNSRGLTLYQLPSETNGQITCTGSCASAWPPLLAVNGKVPSAPSAIAAKLGMITRPDGSVQVTFNGMPLYTFAGEAAGQASGQGVAGFVAVTTASTTATNGGVPGY